MNSFEHLLTTLDAHQQLGQSLLVLLEREHETLRKPAAASPFGFYQERKNLLPLLDRTLASLKKERGSWQLLSPAERAQYPRINALLQANQDLIMKLILLDRENEQILLRRGLVPPNHLPAANRQRPHFVADLYRRHHNS